MKDAEMAAEMRQQTEILKKIGSETDALKGEIVKLNEQVDHLEKVINGMGSDTSPELQSAFDDLKAQVKVVDDKVNDLPPPIASTEPPIEVAPK